MTVRGSEVHSLPRNSICSSILARHPGKVITHRALLKAVWGGNSTEQAEYLRVFVGQLRKKMEPDASSPSYIVTEPWVGYRFEPAGSDLSTNSPFSIKASFQPAIPLTSYELFIGPLLAFTGERSNEYVLDEQGRNRPMLTILTALCAGRICILLLWLLSLASSQMAPTVAELFAKL